MSVTERYFVYNYFERRIDGEDNLNDTELASPQDLGSVESFDEAFRRMWVSKWIEVKLDFMILRCCQFGCHAVTRCVKRTNNETDLH